MVKSAEEKALVWKQDLRIIPLSAGIYFLCFLDRSNIGNAKILNANTKNDMQTECHMSNSPSSSFRLTPKSRIVFHPPGTNTDSR